MYICNGEQITFIKAKCYEYTNEQDGENEESGSARNSESEKNERNNASCKEYVQIRVRKQISQRC
jgi:hypothetical protein